MAPASQATWTELATRQLGDIVKSCMMHHPAHLHTTERGAPVLHRGDTFWCLHSPVQAISNTMAAPYWDDGIQHNAEGLLGDSSLRLTAEPPPPTASH